MGSLTNKPRIMGSHHTHPCTRTHQIGALALVAATFFLTRLFDQSSLTSCHSSSVVGSQGLLRFTGTVGSISWPHRGYGHQLSLKIYVYDEREIDGLRLLLYGRDGKISADACVKGQWGTQGFTLYSSAQRSACLDAPTIMSQTSARRVPGHTDCCVSMGVVRRNFAIQVTFCPPLRLGIAADRCPSVKLWRSYPTKLTIDDNSAMILALALWSPATKERRSRIPVNIMALPHISPFVFSCASTFDWDSKHCAVKIHRMLLQSRFRTRKKEEADLFFVPTYVKCVRMMGGLSDKEINQTYVKVLSQMPYFRLSSGRNHIFVFPSGAGASLFRSWATYLNRSIILTPEGDRTDKRDTSAFNTWKDIIIPGNVDDGMTTHGAKLVQPLPLSKRKYLANFLGRAQGKIGRLQLVELAKQYPDKLESPELKFSGPDKLGRREYFEHLINAKFCLAPRGESSWTLRFYESFFVRVCPGDHIRLRGAAFSECYRLHADIDQMAMESYSHQRHGSIEVSFPDKDIERMIAYGRQVRCLWVYAPESEPCSAFNGIMWDLQRKVRQFHQSPETFWLHNGSIVNRNLEEFSHWKPPLPLP
ncbi:exostosin family protein [Actinidia rufa]|uniref:Exostosin family protein n=1 Tax=Actinidia rufa TaxID=165716 RepID=A0A7J0EG43_9ERIC|nr:exostosin family protein [Actinidia rufa]